MAEVIDHVQHDFWRPPAQTAGVATSLERAATCTCGSEFIVGSLFCHSCGARRATAAARPPFEIPGQAELSALSGRLGLTMPAAVAFLIGLFCMVGALAVSVFFSARTALDWQAIQLWRIEWLIAAVAAFGAGCLLKK